MAIQDILGGGLPAGLLTPEQETAAQQRAQNAGLLNLAFGLLQASQGQQGQRKPSLGQIIGQAGPVGVAGYQQSFDKTLKDTLTSMQIQEMKRKQAEEERKRQIQERLSQLAPQLITTQREPSPTTGAFDAGQGIDVMQGGEGVVPQPQVTGYGINTAVLPALAALGPEGMAYAKSISDFQKSLQPEYLTVGESVYVKKPEGGLQKIVSAGGKFTGDYANIAMGIYGTADANEILSKDPTGFDKIQAGVLTVKKAGASSINLPSEGERKAGFLTNRVKFGLEQMSGIIGKNPPAASPEAIPSLVRYLTGSEFLSNKLTSEDRQRIEAAQLDVLDAALTLGTGAAYTKEQIEGYRKSYFPQLGDDPKTVKDKQVRLQNLLESAYISAGRAAPSESPSKFGQTTQTKGENPPAGVPQELWNVMTPQERALWKK